MSPICLAFCAALFYFAEEWVIVLSASPSDGEEPVNLPVCCRSLCFFLPVWGVGNTACCLRDSHQGSPPSSGLQHPSVPQRWSSSSIPAHLPGVTGRSQLLNQCQYTFLVFRDCYSQYCVCLKEHRDEHLTAIPQEVCLSFVKIIQEVLGSPPDMDLLKLIYNFLLAVHPPTNTYVCHTPSSFYFSLHIGEEAVQLKAVSVESNVPFI